MFKLVLTGGPCSGKTTSLSRIESELAQRGYKVLIVPETATELILSRVGPNNTLKLDDFQRFVFRSQLFKEGMMDEMAAYYDPDRTVIVYDRGLMDGMAYTSEKNFKAIAKEQGLTIAKIMNRYDAVFHLTTAAKGTDCYTTANNAARRETPEEAIESDEKTMKVWVRHPHLKVFNNKVNFEEKVGGVVNELLDMLGQSKNLEIERKFLIRKPNKETLQSLPFCTELNLVQMYLKSDRSVMERRVRQMGIAGDFSYFYTEKHYSDNPIERVEIERRIPQSKYINYFSEVDPTLHPVVKTRYCFVYDDRKFELDIYDGEDEFAILEVEMSRRDEEFEIPECIEVIKDVTADSRFKNVNIAKTSPFKDASAVSND